MANKRIVFLPKYSSKAPSSRYRIYQYLQFYRKNFEIEIYPLLDDIYIDYLYKKQTNKIALALYVFMSYVKRILLVIFAKRGEVFYIGGGEILPYCSSCFEKYLKCRKISFILDYDDAIFHNYDKNKNRIIRFLYGKKIPKAIAFANHIVTGSPYLTEYAKLYNQNVIEIPTSIDINKYSIKKNATDSIFKIGWIGSKTTSRNILPIIPAIKKIMAEINCEFVLIGFDSELKLGVNCTIKQWNESEEVNDIKQLDIGIMPLEDNPFNKGKCGFKLVQYMACGLPTISTPLDANIKINRDNMNLFASTNDEWYEKMLYIYNNRENYIRIGKKNREIAKKYYSIQSNYQKYIELINRL
jgi:glycosyltransferase involved in cell wall biosynthesis